MRGVVNLAGKGMRVRGRWHVPAKDRPEVLGVMVVPAAELTWPPQPAASPTTKLTSQPETFKIVQCLYQLLSQRFSI